MEGLSSTGEMKSTGLTMQEYGLYRQVDPSLSSAVLIMAAWQPMAARRADFLNSDLALRARVPILN